MNPARTQWAAGIILRENGRGSFASTKTVSGGLEGLKILDVGCGAGIATEAFAALGATVTGIDANPDAIEVAKLRLENEAKGIASHTSYVCGTVEEHLATHAGYYDAVVSFEVVEHVNRPSFFIKSLVSAAKPGAPLCLSTINKNPLSYALAIALGEYITRMVPVGTHSWEKFLTPAELEGMMRDAGCIVSETKGLQPCPSLVCVIVLKRRKKKCAGREKRIPLIYLRRDLVIRTFFFVTMWAISSDCRRSPFLKKILVDQRERERGKLINFAIFCKVGVCKILAFQKRVVFFEELDLPKWG